MRTVRGWLAYKLVRWSGQLPAGYVTWLLFRWSVQLATHVTEMERAAALKWWDRMGVLWGYRRIG